MTAKNEQDKKTALKLLGKKNQSKKIISAIKI